MLVAHKLDEPNVVYGYLVCTKRSAVEPHLHYAFVKEAFRSKGIATALYAEAIGAGATAIASHRTGKAKRALQRHPEITFNPYVLIKGDPK